MTPGLRFRNLDLHVHTPASQCFIEPDVSPDDIVQVAMDAGLDAIAITDHNTSAWIDRVKAAAQDTPLTIFPGVEITVQLGVHVLALFPETAGGAQVSDLLSELGIRAGKRGDQTAFADRTVQQVIEAIRAHGALPVLAHIDDHSGAWVELRASGQTLIQLWEAGEFAAVEIVGEGLPEEIGRDPFHHRPAYYWASDNPHPGDPSKHSQRGIGKRYSRFKLGEPITWEGLRLAFHDPSTRIRPPAGDESQHACIESVRIDGGFLHDTQLELNPNLNCIVGGRGTGKSTLLEIVRYTFDLPPKTDSNLRQFESIVENTFPPGARARVAFSLAGGASYLAERVYGEAPRIFRPDGEELSGVSPAELLPLQVYGQKEIYEISQDAEFQLRLLDNYLEEQLRPILAEEKELLRRLNENATDILQLEEQVESAQEQLAGRGALEEEVRRMEQQDYLRRVRTQQQYEHEKHLLDQAAQRFEKLIAELARLGDELLVSLDDMDEAALTELPNTELLAAQRRLFDEINGLVSSELEALRRKIESKWDELAPERKAWGKAYRQQELVYQELLREFQAAGHSLEPDRYLRLQNRLRELDALGRKTQQQRAQIEKLYSQREEMLSELRVVRRRQYETRRDKAAELSAKLGGAVRITITPQGLRAKFDESLERLFYGQNVRSPARTQIVKAEAPEPERAPERPVEMHGETRYLVPRIPRYLDPIDLAEAIRMEQSGASPNSLLEANFGVDSEAMRRNIALISPEKLFTLETLAVPDLPRIELQVGRGEFGYKPLSALSVGQRCTALLSLVLLESPAPLLIDQPEDDLDNQFIFDQIVATLRHEKERRQFIIATHNANIPVSGDAELIIALQADDKRGWAAEDCVGSIDSEPIKQFVERILEGGEAAFRMRKEKYGIV